jgi:coenzyme F420-reducing hydrogenase gamma subunit
VNVDESPGERAPTSSLDLIAGPAVGAPARRPTLAVWKFASCDGCQLSLLDLEHDLLQLVSSVEISYFLEVTRSVAEGPYDISLVEGSVTTPGDAERIKTVRTASRFLVAIGACATAGGIQALRNYAKAGEYVPTVYPNPSYISSLATSTPVSAHVPVDFELHGCPVSSSQLLEVVTAYLAGRAPRIPDFPVCRECKAAGNVCLLVAKHTPCLGPVTSAGCGALCPSVGRGCFGCFGPASTVNTASLSRCLLDNGATDAELYRLFRSFTAGAPQFQLEKERSRRDPAP